MAKATTPTTTPKATTPVALVPVFTLEVPVDGLEDGKGNAIRNPILHGIYVAKADNVELGKKLYTGKKGVFYPDDLDIQVKKYAPAGVTNPPPPADEPDDEPCDVEEKPKKKGKKAKKDK